VVYAPGLVTGPLSGLAGSTLAASNQTGHHITAHRAHSRPLSPGASLAQSNFGSIAALLRSLTSAQVEAWAQLATSIRLTGRLGRPITLTAANLHLRINRTLAVLELPYSPDAPPLTIPPGVVDPTLTALPSP
jgi:hypothetical protein